jgi:hypothetical protein
MRTWRKKSLNHSFFLIKKECRCSFFIIAWKDWKKILPWNVVVIYSTLVNWKKKLPSIKVVLFANLKIKTFITCSFVELKKNSTHSHYFKKKLNGQWLFICFIINLYIKVKNKFHFFENTCSSHTYHIVCSQLPFFCSLQSLEFPNAKNTLQFI